MRARSAGVWICSHCAIPAIPAVSITRDRWTSLAVRRALGWGAVGYAAIGLVAYLIDLVEIVIRSEAVQDWVGDFDAAIVFRLLDVLAVILLFVARAVIACGARSLAQAVPMLVVFMLWLLLSLASIAMRIYIFEIAADRLDLDGLRDLLLRLDVIRWIELVFRSVGVAMLAAFGVTSLRALRRWEWLPLGLVAGMLLVLLVAFDICDLLGWFDGWWDYAGFRVSLFSLGFALFTTLAVIWVLTARAVSRSNWSPRAA
jgi:hypothetical protein